MVNPWKKLTSREIYGNAWMRVREDRVLRPDGNEGLYGVVEIRPSVGVIALDAEDRVALVGQWRYPLERYSWEIPRGGSHEGETDLREVAARELREEAGVEAGRWTALGPVDLCNGLTTDVEHLFLAEELRYTGERPDPEEELVVQWVPFEEAVRKAVEGGITECCSVAGILRLAARRAKGER